MGNIGIRFLIGFGATLRARLRQSLLADWKAPSRRYLAPALGLSLMAMAAAGWSRMGSASAADTRKEANGFHRLSEGQANSNLNIDLLPAFEGPRTELFAAGKVRRFSDIRTVIPSRPRLEITRYTVQAGDTLFGIAEKFVLKPETILWGNYELLQDDPHSLRPGQGISILPVDGAYYEWQEGDSLSAAASFFGVEAAEILDWPGNPVDPAMDRANPAIAPGTELIIPGGRREFVSWRAPRITRSNPAVARVAGPGACDSIYDGPVGEGFFIWPTTASLLSGFSYSSFHPGIDIAGSPGNAIFASASGVVVYAGWNNYGYGYMVVIDHGNRWQTLYAHMSQVNVACGQAVFQGNVIGGVGSTGNSTGAHLHFEMQHDVYGKVNPYDLVSP